MNVFITAIHEPVVIAAIFTLLGSLSGTIVSLVSIRYENRRHLRELGFKLAVTHFEHRMREQQAIADVTNQIREVDPLPVMIAECMKAAEIASSRGLTGYEVGRRLAGLSDYAKEVQRGIKEQISGQRR